MTQRRLTQPMRRTRRSRLIASQPGSHPLLWLFDLDNTLHDTSYRIFDAIRDGMTQAIMQTLDVDEQTAHTLRHRYWERYGATMIGLTKHHNVDPQEFLDRSHDFELTQRVRAPRGLSQKLQSLPGRKVVATNAPRLYACAVLRHLNILHHFDGMWSVEDMRIHGHYRPKPSQSILRYILTAEAVPAHRAVLIEDTLENLKAARAVGLRTVHVFHPGTPFAHQRKGRAPYVDLRVNDVCDVLLNRRVLR